MKPESVTRMKSFLDARDLLHGAREQYEGAIVALKGALDYADTAMSEYRDEEAGRQIEAMRKLIAGLPRASFEAIDAIAETMEALAIEVSADEEHVPGGVS